MMRYELDVERKGANGWTNNRLKVSANDLVDVLDCIDKVTKTDTTEICVSITINQEIDELEVK